MENPQPKRRLKLHCSTWVVGLLTLFLTTVIVLPGNPAFPGINFRFESKSSHGWPWEFLARSNRIKPGILQGNMARGILQYKTVFGVPWLSWDAWSVWEANRGYSFSPWYLLLDLIAMAVVVVSFSAVWEWWRRRRRRLWQFSLREVGVMTAIVAIPLGWCTYQRNAVLRETGHRETLDKHPHIDWSYGHNSYNVPLWLERLLGRQLAPKWYFIQNVNYSTDHNDESARLASFLPILQDFSHLEELSVKLQVQEEVDLFSSIAVLTQVRRLHLTQYAYPGAFDVAFAEEVIQMHQLRSIYISFGKKLTPEARRLMVKRLPNCTIKFLDDE